MDLNSLLVRHILSLNPLEATVEFINNIDALSEFRFVYFCEKGAQFSQKLEELRGDGYELCSYTHSEGLFIVDRNSCLGMMANDGAYTSKIVVCINFDTQALSYITRYFFDRKNDYDIERFLSKLINSKADYTPIPYYMENIGKNDNGTKLGTWKIMMLYCFLIDARSANDILNPPADFYRSEYALKADETYRFMQETYNNPRFNIIPDTQKIVYALLLKCCILKLTDKYSKSFIKDFFDFVAYDVGLFLDREVAVCYLFLSKNEFPLFFKHIKPNAKNILQRIRAMSWDLTHLRTLEIMTSADQYDNDATFTLHALITYDKGLMEIVKALPAKAMAFYKDNYRIIFKHSLPDIVSEVDLSEYFSPEIQEKRVRTGKYQDINALISDLEKAIAKEGVL